jgi:hypothetical protein
MVQINNNNNTPHLAMVNNLLDKIKICLIPSEMGQLKSWQIKVLLEMIKAWKSYKVSLQQQDKLQ